MINDDSQYLSHSCENFSNIVLSVPSGNGISILARADKRRSRTHRTSHSRSRQFPKRVKASRMKNEGEARGWSGGEGGAKRARQTSVGRRRRARIKRDIRRGQLTQEVPQKDGKRGRGFRTRLCFQAGSSRSRLSSALIARRT